MKTIGIIDYGMGNLHSVKNALDFIGANSFISDKIEDLSKADGLILPGVGAFPDAMERLKKTTLDKFIKEYSKGHYLIGICLGMQLLFDVSYEFSKCEGLSLICGEICKIDDEGLKVPHMGWNNLNFLKPSKITEGLSDNDYVYFVHSFKAHVKDRSDLIAVSEYGSEVAAIVGKGNVFGCQFHPEKSEAVGLKILENFWRLVNADSTCN